MRVVTLVMLIQRGVEHFDVFVESSFRVEFHALEKIYLIDDFIELVLYFESGREPVGTQYADFCAMMVLC